MKIDLTTAPTGAGTRYPEPHNAPCKARTWIALGAAAGLTQFGVNLVRLKPGVWSSQRHWHTHEDEFAYLIEGELVLVTDEGETLCRAGDCAGFKGGVQNGHKFENRSDRDAVLLVVGSRLAEDSGEYSDIDMKFLDNRYQGGGGYTTKDGKDLCPSS